MPNRTRKLKFKVSSGIKDIVGRDLIPDDNIGVFELVKNCYDAYATKVVISFFDIYGEKPKIIIEDNGKGMNSADLENKWLFLGFSAKKEGTEDKDYRNKIFQDKPFAGSKGIGRFSSDRLGKKLLLETIKDASKTRKEILEIDWTKFEHKLSDEFIKISVTHYPSESALRKNHGTKLIITELRSDWNRKKIIGLRKSLSKLINPEDSFSSKKFKISINCPEEIEEDKESDNFNKVNGYIKNFIFEDLEIRTTKINVFIDTKGKYVTTELRDGGTLIYKIKEKSVFPETLRSISFKVFYLNKAAKDTFKRRMGVRTRNYGSIFVYKNNIRIYPFGEPTEDSFNLDKRKAQKPSVYLGNKDLIGNIEIGQNDEFNETSSRGDGFIKNDTYKNFLLALEKYVIDRLERYVIDVQKWGGAYLSIEDESLGDKIGILQNRITGLIAKISNSSEIVDFQYDDDILNILDTKQSDSAEALVSNLFKIAKDSNNRKLLKVAEKTRIRVQQLRTALVEAQKDAEEKKKALEEKVSENLFLKSIKSQDLDEVVTFMHSVGISATTIENYLSSTYQKLSRGISIPNEDIKRIIENISIENRKILSISRFATKANFKLYAEDSHVDLVEFISEYATNILRPLRKEDIEIRVMNPSHVMYLKTIKPIEISILLDNFLSNSIRAKAKHFTIEFKRNDNEGLVISLKDDGKGIINDHLNRIFDFGFTTTSGSGLGLFHIKQIMDKMKAAITVNNRLKQGVEFIINFK
jgi:signal transduction histidine kinase